MNFRLIYVISFYFFTTCFIAQDLDHYVIGTDGNFAKNNQFSLSYTIGEVVTELGRDRVNNIDLTQGFQQSMLAVVSVEEHVEDILIDVYPNPAIDHLNINIPQILEGMTYSMYDINGKLLLQKEVTVTNFQIGFNAYSTGNYLLVFMEKEKPLKTLKIQKSH